jgi:hypothetical protein
MKSKTLGRAKKENLMYNASFFMHDALSQSENGKSWNKKLKRFAQFKT